MTTIEGQLNGKAPSTGRTNNVADPKGRPADDAASQKDDGFFDRLLTSVAAKEARPEEAASKPSEGQIDRKGRLVDGVGVQPADGSFHRLLTHVAEKKLGLDGESVRGEAPSTMGERGADDITSTDSIEGLTDGARPADPIDPFIEPSGDGSAPKSDLAAAPLPDVSVALLPPASSAMAGEARFPGAAVAEKKVRWPSIGPHDAGLSAEWPQHDVTDGVSLAEDGAPLFMRLSPKEARSDGMIVLKVTAAVFDQQTHLPPVDPAPIDQILSRIVAEAGATEPTEPDPGLGSSNGGSLPKNAVESLLGTFSVVKILNLRLEPAHLGVVTIRMRLSGSTLGLEVETEQAAAADLLSKEGVDLAEKLLASGYSLEKLVIKSAPRPFLSPGGEGVLSGERPAQTGLFDLDGALPVNAQNGEPGGNGRRQPRTQASAPDDAADAPDAPSVRPLHGARFV